MEIQRILLGYSFSTIVGALFLVVIIDGWFWGYLIKKENISGKPGAIFTVPLGIIERFLYTATIIMECPGWIPIWLGLKVAVSWKRWQDEKQRGTYNIFLIGNALSLIFGFLGAWIVLGHLPSLKTK